MKNDHLVPFADAHRDIETSRTIPDTPQTRSPAYRLAFTDNDFLCRDELRPLRLQLELMKPELMQSEYEVKSTIVLFGGARIPRPENRDQARTETLASLSPYYEKARRFARIITKRNIGSNGRENVIVTGGGPGVMEAGNRGAADAGGVSIGLNIVLPHEQAPNEFVTPDLCFNFHYFGIRKMHFLLRARAVVGFPGGFGTLDELFETLTLIQTKKMQPIPVILFGKAFWRKIIDWDALAEAGTISDDDLNLFQFVETAEEAVEMIDRCADSGKTL